MITFSFMGFVGVVALSFVAGGASTLAATIWASSKFEAAKKKLGL